MCHVLYEQLLQKFVRLHVFRNVGFKEGVAFKINKGRIFFGDLLSLKCIEVPAHQLHFIVHCIWDRRRHFVLLAKDLQGRHLVLKHLQRLTV